MCNTFQTKMNTNLIQEWTLEGNKLNGHAEHSDITRCKIALNFTFPADLKVYQVYNEFAEWQWDSRMLLLEFTAQNKQT